jgi:hypothetical protein
MRNFQIKLKHIGYEFVVMIDRGPSAGYQVCAGASRNVGSEVATGVFLDAMSKLEFDSFEDAVIDVQKAIDSTGAREPDCRCGHRFSSHAGVGPCCDGDMSTEDFGCSCTEFELAP